MFCPLERIELKVNYCPAKKCMYKTQSSTCGNSELTAEELTVYDIAKIKGVKPYLVKAEASKAKVGLSRGLGAWRYAEYIKDSFPSTEVTTVDKSVEQTVNMTEDKKYRVLKTVFGLTKYQQEKFWDTERYKNWAARNKVQYSITDIKHCLDSAHVM